MVDFYIKRIVSGKMTIDDVPTYWREAVREALENREASDEVSPLE